MPNLYRACVVGEKDGKKAVVKSWTVEAEGIEAAFTKAREKAGAGVGLYVELLYAGLDYDAKPPDSSA